MPRRKYSLLYSPSLESTTYAGRGAYFTFILLIRYEANNIYKSHLEWLLFIEYTQWNKTQISTKFHWIHHWSLKDMFTVPYFMRYSILLLIYLGYRHFEFESQVFYYCQLQLVTWRLNETTLHAHWHFFCCVEGSDNL